MPNARPKLIFGFSVVLVLAWTLAITFLCLWPRPVSLVIAGAAMLLVSAAMLVLGIGAGGKHLLRMQKGIFLASGVYGVMLLLLALKNHRTSPAFSTASLLTFAMLCSGAAATHFIPLWLDKRKGEHRS